MAEFSSSFYRLIYGSVTKLPKYPPMIYLRKIHSWRFLTIQASTCLNSSTPYQSLWRPFSFSAQFQKESDSLAKKKPLSVFFQEAIGLIEKSEVTESEGESDNKELKCKLRKLEEKVRILRAKRKDEKSRNGNGVLENEGKSEKLHELSMNEEVKSVKSRNGNGVLENEGKSKKLHELFMNEEVKSVKSSNGNEVLENEGKSKKLHELFKNKEVNKSVKSRKLAPLSMEDHTVYKELSPDMVMFVTHLYNEGYFKDSNFLPRKKFDITCFENSYARDFVKCAAEQFGRDHQEIAKWLSGSDLKKVALFGCPSIAKKTVFSAKRLRTYFRIQEDNVCSKCALKASCKFVNQNVWKGDMTNLHLAVVMRVITLYALESVPPQLVIPDEIKASVNRLLMDILRLSQTVS